MNKGQRWISFLLCACMLVSMAAFAEEAAQAPEAAAEVTEAVAVTVPEIQDDTVVATLNGEEIKWSDIKADYANLVGNYGSYYDMASQENVDLFRAVALQTWLYNGVLPLQEAKKMGLDQFSAEETATLNAEVDQMWKEANESYIAQNFQLTDASTEEEKAQAKAAAEAYFLEQGYTLERYREDYLRFKTIERVREAVTQDVTVTDADVEGEYQAKVAADKAKYENDLSAYIAYNQQVDQMEMYAMMYGQPNTMEKAWYKPAGFRAVKHILLPVDEQLMSSYKELQSRLEEQQDAEAAQVQGDQAAVPAQEPVAPEATAALEGTAEPTGAPVTQEDVNNAKADILTSMQDKIDEISQKVADGVDFDELIATYGVKADGTPSDPGMNAEPYKTKGYEVARESSDYVKEFVDAAFSVDNVGDVTAPYLSDYGIHIVKYIGDVAAAPVEMTAEQREARRATLLEEKKDELFAAKLDEWMKASSVTYTGVILSMEELEKRNGEASEAAAPETAEEAGTEDAVVEEAAQPEAPAVDQEAPAEVPQP